MSSSISVPNTIEDVYEEFIKRVELVCSRNVVVNQVLSPLVDECKRTIDYHKKDRFTSLPDEIANEILYRLDPLSLLRCCRTCRRLNILSSGECIWMKIAVENWMKIRRCFNCPIKNHCVSASEIFELAKVYNNRITAKWFGSRVALATGRYNVTSYVLGCESDEWRIYIDSPKYSAYLRVYFGLGPCDGCAPRQKGYLSVDSSRQWEGVLVSIGGCYQDVKNKVFTGWFKGFQKKNGENVCSCGTIQRGKFTQYAKVGKGGTHWFHGVTIFPNGATLTADYTYFDEICHDYEFLITSEHSEYVSEDGAKFAIEGTRVEKFMKVFEDVQKDCVEEFGKRYPQYVYTCPEGRVCSICYKTILEKDGGETALADWSWYPTCVKRARISD